VDFYVKNDSGEYAKATEAQIDELFKEKSDRIVAAKLKSRREKIREEVEAELRKEITEAVKAETGDTIKAEARKEVEAEYQDKLSKSESKAKELDIKLRRKIIAAEYGFKADAEKFLGDGDDEAMRANADALKTSFLSNESSGKKVEKQTSEPTETGYVTLSS